MRELNKYLLLIPLFLFAIPLFAQEPDLLKNFLTVEDGLSHNEVTSIVQDKDGFIWIGTRGGLNRYDGYEFKIFNQVPGDSNSLVNPSIETLFVDSKGNIWIGTKSGGVSKYNPVTGVFTNIVSNYKNENEILSSNRILTFYEDKKGKVWMGTWNQGLVIYDEETNTSRQFLNGIINSIVESADGDIWVGGDSGLHEFKLDDYSCSHYIEGVNCQEIVYDEKRNVMWIAGSSAGLHKFNLLNRQIETFHISSSVANPEYAIYTYESILIDKADRIWVGTWGTGFYQFDQDNQKFVRHVVHPENVATLNKDYDAVLDIFQDKTGNIWLGTNGGGVVVLTEKLDFKSVGYHSQPGKGLPNTKIMSVVDDRNGNLWLGTIGGGLFWSPDKENFYSVQNNAFSDNRFFIIKYLYEADDGTIWVGTNNRMFIVEFENGTPKLINASDKFWVNEFGNNIVSLAEKDNLLLLGLLQGGLILVDKSDEYKFIRRISKANSKNGTLKSNRISYLLRDTKERIWVGTYNGLHVFNANDTSIVLAEEQYDISGEFTGNIITCLDEDPMGNIWIGTPNGLNKLSESGNNKFTVEYYTEEDGLASNFIKGISHDLNGNVWLSTNVGISKLANKDDKKVVNFDEKDGVNGKNFTEASVFRNDKGEIFFGGAYGLTYFNPDEIIERTSTSKPVFTGLSILNQKIEPSQEVGNKKVLSKSITHTNEIVLSHQQNKIEIQFSALDFESAGRNNYMVYLENYDEEWNEIGSRRFAIFNNLNPGEYLLHVKCSNRHKIWNEEATTLRIVVKPPIWQTWYALLFYILVVVGIVTVIRLNAVKQVRLANSLDMEKLQHQQDQKINEMKLRFFTNLSHEFRTPLTLILAPLKELLGKKEEYQLSNEAQNKIGIVQNNSLRLMNLVNQLLDFRKVESGNMKLAATNTNMEEFVAEVCHPFIELARINNIRFKLNSSLKTKNIWVDRDKLEIILNNLISNSFKNSKVNGKIEVALYEEEDVVLLSISDNGSGIPKTEIANIFERFYRVGKSSDHGSSGIGLALVKRYTELHKGSISVVSEVDKHTEFTVSLSKGSNHLDPEEMVEHEQSEPDFVRKEQFFSSVLPVKEKQIAKSEECILIVEDNEEVNNYLRSILEASYCVYSAANGSEGFEIANEKTPNLIISDVMMPKMDGFEFCKKIRENNATAIIPFIFLTAKSDEQFKLLGTQLGADDFLSKPFDPNLLLEKVKNILESRKKLQKQYSKSVRLGPSDIEITSGEEVFIEKVILTIEENLQNHKFTSDVLASEMNMSNSSLYRKLKVLTGSSTAEFVRSIRIKRAAQLLADRERTITEIAYEVGFNDVKHFRTVFQKQFACTPSEYREKL